jgi:riboflavin kinase/FMN adenylyltransferase
MSVTSAGSAPEVRWLGSVSPRPRSAAIGTFDGVHLGHRRVIAGAGTVITFTPHPRAVFGQAPPLLHDLERKIEVLGGIGVEEVVLIPFDRELAAMTPETFVHAVLVETLGITRLAVGANFHFGRCGAGGVADLVADQRFETRVEPLFVDGREVVSSTRIRELVAAGETREACRLLGDPLSFRCLLVPQTGGESIALRWPTGLVRPAPGRYAATVQGPEGPEVAVEVELSEECDRIVAAAGPLRYGAAILSLGGSLVAETPELIASAA